MKDYQAQYSGTRKCRVWWAVHNNKAKQVQGFDCGPHNPDMWWCPEIGESLSEKYHLFETEREAWLSAISKLDTQIGLLCDQRDYAHKQLSEVLV